MKIDTVKYTLPHYENAARAISTLQAFRGAKFNELIDSLILRGWLVEQAPLGVCAAVDVDVAISEYKNEFATLASDVIYKAPADKDAGYAEEKVTGADVVAYIEANYTQGNVASAVSGNRRTYAIPIANIVRERRKLEPVKPVFVEMSDSLEASMLANTAQTAGVQGTQAIDALSWHSKYRVQNPVHNESALLEFLKRGMAQTIHRIHRLQNNHPSLPIYEKMLSQEWPIPNKELTKELIDLGSGKRAESTIRKALQAGKVAKPQRATVADLENAASSTQSALLRFAFDCFASGKVGELVKTVSPHASEIDSHFPKLVAQYFPSDDADQEDDASKKSK